MTKMTKANMQSIITAVLTALEAAGKSPSKAKKYPSVAKKPVYEHKTAAVTDPKMDRKLKIEAATVKAFAKAGYGEVTPRVDVRTYNRWLADGRKVRVGEKSIKVGTLRLFHMSQTDAYVAPPKEDVAQESLPHGAVAIDKNGKPVFVTKVPMGVSGTGARVEMPEPPMG